MGLRLIHYGFSGKQPNLGGVFTLYHIWRSVKSLIPIYRLFYWSLYTMSYMGSSVPYI